MGGMLDCSEKPDPPSKPMKPTASPVAKRSAPPKLNSKEELKEREERWDKLIGKNNIVAKPQFSDKSRELVANWNPRPTDILIATPAKTGTTWLQQLTHILRGGDMDFEDVYQVSPWQLMAFDVGLELDGEQPLHKKDATALFPRTYKTHQLPSACPSGAKFLVTCRSPPKVWSSAYRFFKAKDLPPLRDVTGMNDLKAYGCTVEDMAFGGSLFDYYVEFWKLKAEPNLLIICYEDLQKDTRKFVPLIADFMGLPVPDKKTLDKVLEMSSKGFMGKHMEKFDESWCHKKLKEVGTHNRPDDFAPSDRVSKAVPVNKTVEDFLQKEWEKHMTPHTGHKNYKEYADAIRKVTAKRFAALAKKLSADDEEKESVEPPKAEAKNA